MMFALLINGEKPEAFLLLSLHDSLLFWLPLFLSIHNALSSVQFGDNVMIEKEEKDDEEDDDDRDALDLLFLPTN